ncbi:MAG: hypothetical protein LUD79_09120 [Oscillospiraceae bacterium]|nr:hypothetical protein [Oscillospiraceae bacterium]
MRRKDISYYSFLVFLYFFVFNSCLEQVIPLLGYADELVALCAVPLAVLALLSLVDLERMELRWYSVFLALYVAVTFLANLVYRIQPLLSAALPDLLLCLKFWLALYVGRRVFRGFDCKAYAGRMFIHLKVIILFLFVCTVTELLTGARLFGASVYRYGLPAIELFFGHPTRFCAVCVFLFVVLVSLRQFVSGSEKYLLALLLMMGTTLRTKAIVAAILFCVIYYLAFLRKRKITAKTAFLALPPVLILSWEQISYYFFSDVARASARYQLTVKAVQIANDYFPFGTGFGTYGSYYSGVVYSALYDKYGLSDVWGIQPTYYSFLSDTFWPMILGQSGWFGMASYALALLFLLHTIQKLRSISPAFYTSALCIFIYLLISSLAESAFVHPMAIPLAIWLGFLLQTADSGRLEVREGRTEDGTN